MQRHDVRLPGRPSVRIEWDSMYLSMFTLFVLGLVSLVGLVAVAAATIPVHRWSFEVAGQSIQVQNYVTHESVVLDGDVQSGTRTGGNYMSFATHRAQLADGSHLEVRIESGSYGLTMQCHARRNGRLVFSTDTMQEPAAVEEEVVPEDARWRAARLILGTLTAQNDPDLASAARQLRATLDARFERLEAAHALAQAVATLGGDDAAVATEEAAVDELLVAVRALHAAAAPTARQDDAVARAHAVAERLATERDGLRRARDARRLPEG
ncbi:MAG: hypothetical protein ACI8PZ_001345 [Myxococcota bacterium]|jgi:hypothetical protein